MPKKIVRFYNNIDFALETIARNEVTLIHPSRFNDPFDPNFKMQTEFNDYDKLLFWVSKNQKKHLEYFVKFFPRQNLSAAISQTEEKLKIRFDNTYILSTSAVQRTHPAESFYMWGHYADGHRGVAIEFDTRKLSSIFASNTEHPVRGFSKVIYVKELPKITYDEIFEFIMSHENKEFSTSKLEKKMTKIFSCKHNDWRFEKEYRLMEESDETKMHFIRKQLKPNTISAIYLGCRITDSEIIKAFEWETNTKQPSATLYHVQQNDKELALQFKQLLPSHPPSSMK